MADAPRILLLAHDLSDAAIERRVLMLRSGGADVTVAGFRRTAAAVLTVGGCPAVDLGQTYSAGFLHRIWSVIRETLHLRQHQELLAKSDIVIARNLEMLALGVRGLAICSKKPVLVYECLDIHRLLLRGDIVGKLLRRLEGWLSSHASSLLTSSPAFIEHYFKTLSEVRLPTRLIENKVLVTGDASDIEENTRPEGPPWVIGWFGIIRCRKSLLWLADLVRHSQGTIKVVIRGRPALNEIPDFDSIVKETPGITFGGPYKNPDDLAAMYHDVHFTWAIDMFEEGLNSSWLLPNRLYEGGLYHSVPIALGNVETGKFLKLSGIGVIVEEPKEPFLFGFFQKLTYSSYQELANAARAIPKSVWTYGIDDCRSLVSYLAGLVPHG